MIKSNNTINIEGTVVDHDELQAFLSLDGNDFKTKWIMRPLIIISGIGLAVAALFASVFLMAVSLVIVPVLGVAAWVMKSNLKKAASQSQESTTVEVEAINENNTGTPDPV